MEGLPKSENFGRKPDGSANDSTSEKKTRTRRSRNKPKIRNFDLNSDENVLGVQAQRNNMKQQFNPKRAVEPNKTRIFLPSNGSGNMNLLLAPSTSRDSGENNRKPPRQRTKNMKYLDNEYSLKYSKILPLNPHRIWKPPVDASKFSGKDHYKMTQSKLTPIKFNFVIKPVKNSVGLFLRKRSSCSCINLKSFGSNTVFVSRIKLPPTLVDSIEILVEETEKLSIVQTLETERKMERQSSSVTETKSNKPKRIWRRRRNIVLTPENSNRVINTEEEPLKIKKPKRNNKKRWTSSKKQDFKKYPSYLNELEVEQGLKDGTLVKGFIRINQRNRNEAYVTSIIKGDTDYFIKSVIDQNRALDGDEVILKLNPETEWEEGRKSATVVFISKMVHSRITVGKLNPPSKNDDFAAFLPRDKRTPTIHIPMISWPNGFQSDPKKFNKHIFVAKITNWTSPEYAKGLIIENIGSSSELKNENLAILKTHGLDHEPFTNDLLKCLPKLNDSTLSLEWLKGRRDLRKECIFTIDPLTARDLDDAVSCKVLPNGNYEIGVHIADVAFFLKEGNDLDKHVAFRATSTYMVDQVHHMLPVELCMACSLLPGKDKLSFSVFWEMTRDGEIISTDFSRTIMNSCAQLAYEHAQEIIENPDQCDAREFPNIHNGYTFDDIKDTVSRLYDISKILRKRRFENGALRIDQIKLSFDLDPVSGKPLKYRHEVQKEANRLIEEFMLLANISVARKLIETCPDTAFLRLHEAPKESMMIELKSKLESVGIHVDISSAENIQKSLWKYCSNDLPGKIRSIVLNHLFAKPMTRARYFCPGIKLDDSYSHYALNIPLYTHFTSPIRRYADVMVHRLLAGCLGVDVQPDWDPMFVTEVAERCNFMKYNAKKAQEESIKLYYTLFIAEKGPVVREAAVVDARERTFDALVMDSGEIVRIYLNEMNNVSFTLEEIPCVDLNSENKENNKMHKKNWRLKLVHSATKNEPAVEQVIELFTLIRVELKKCTKKHKLVAKLLRPTL